MLSRFHEALAIAATLLCTCACGCAHEVVDAEPTATFDGVATDPATEGTEEPEPERLDPATSRFRSWLQKAVKVDDGTARGLYYAYYDMGAGESWFVSTAVSADVLRFHLAIGERALALETGEALLRWQHNGSGNPGARLAGAFPSEIESDTNGWTAGYLYDSGDNLTIIESLLDLYEASADSRFLAAARRSGTWLRDVMAHGEQFGLWVANLGAPMKAVTRDGDFDNRVPCGRTLRWLPTLRRLAAATQDPSFAELADDAFAFLSLGQTDEGAYADHYDPGWPAQPFELARFQPYGDDGAVVADDSIRAGLGMAREGDGESVERFVAWMSHSSGRIAGYLDFVTGRPHVVPGDPYYFDIISSSLYAELIAASDPALAAAARAFVAQAQSDNGGWPWGWSADRDAPLTDEQSTLTGLWAIMDLAPKG